MDFTIETLNVNDFGSICRICLENKLILRSIFNPTDKFNKDTDDNIYKKLKTVSNIQIQPHDKLPQSICIKCTNFLFTAYFFKKLCEESDARLRSIIKESNISMNTLNFKNYDSKYDCNDVLCDNIRQVNAKTNKCEKQNKCMKIGECCVVFKSNKIKEESFGNSGVDLLNQNDQKDSNGNKKLLTSSFESLKHKAVTKIGECLVIVKTNDIKKESEVFCNEMENSNIEQGSNDVLSQNSDDFVYFDEDSNDYCPSHASSDSFDWNLLSKDMSPMKGMKILPLQPRKMLKKRKVHKKVRHKIVPLIKNKIKRRDKDFNTKSLKHAVIVNKKILPLNKSQMMKKKQDRINIVNTKSTNKPVDVLNKKILPIEKDSSNDRLGYFECLICNVKYNEKVSLYKHMASEHKDKRGFKCYACNLTFKSITGRDDHKRKHCPNEKKSSDTKYECKTCKMTFVDRSSYKVHMKKHKEEIDSDIFEMKYLLKCDHCDYSTSNKHHLKNHLISKHPINNSLIKHFVCETCGKHYTNNSSFRSHITTHFPPVKKYKCSYCDYKTQYSNGIKRHEQTHTRECQYTCEECGKSFITSGALSVHKKRHTGVRDYQCNLCEKNYARKCELTGHIEAVHEKIRPYKCTLEHCSAAFYQRTKCIKHLRQVHKITTNINIPSVKKKKEL